MKILNALEDIGTTGNLPSSKILNENKVSKVKKVPLTCMDNVIPQQEILQLLAQLKEMIPSVPKNRKLSKLEIIQNVIDYIVDLESILDLPSVASKSDLHLTTETSTTTSTATLSTSMSNLHLGQCSQQ